MQLLSDYFAQQNNNYNNRYTDTHPDKMAYNARYNKTSHYINNWHLVIGATFSDLLLQLFRLKNKEQLSNDGAKPSIYLLELR